MAWAVILSNGLDNGKTEMALAVLADDRMRLANISGIHCLIAANRAVLPITSSSSVRTGGWIGLRTTSSQIEFHRRRSLGRDKLFALRHQSSRV